MEERNFEQRCAIKFCVKLDLSPCEFFLFTILKFYLKGRHFGKVENIEEAVTDQLKAIPVSEFQRCYEE